MEQEIKTSPNIGQNNASAVATTTAMQTKVCRKCGKELPVSEFYANKANKDGYHSYCKECAAAANNQRKSGGVAKVYLNEKLATFSPRELIAELRARGYTGELTYVQKIKV